MDRVDEHRDEYESWPLAIKEAVLDGKVAKGMTPTMVLVAIGKPTEVVDRGGGDQVWVYRTGGSSSGSGMGGSGSGILSGTTVGIGAGSGPVYIGAAPTIGLGGGGGPVYDTTEEREIVFRNGVVARADPPKK